MSPRTPASGHRHAAVRRRGFTVLELCALVSILGVLLAMAIPTFARTLRTSKSAEAAEHLGQLVAGSMAYYADYHRPTAEDPLSGGQTHCLPASAGPVPAVPGPNPVPVRFEAETTPGHATFRALGFTPALPVRYSYVFVAGASGCGLEGREQPILLRYLAQGDLDGDGILSQFARRATIQDGGLVVDPLLSVDRRLE